MPATLQRGLAVQIAEMLRERLLTGRMAPGTRVNEVVLARELGTSRGPLREAVRQLVSEGLLVHRPNRGAAVFEADPADVEAIAELRTALETAAARLAADRRDARDVAALHAACARARRLVTAGRAFVHRVDLDFHRTLFEAARSPRIAAAVWRVQQQVIIVRSNQRVGSDHTGASLDDHEAIAAAVAEHDGDRAARLMADHLERVRVQMLTAMTGPDASAGGPEPAPGTRPAPGAGAHPGPSTRPAPDRDPLPDPPDGAPVPPAAGGR